MAKISLLHAVCTVAMLAAVPALAQPQTPSSGLVSANGTANPEDKQPTSGPLAPQNNGVKMAPANSSASMTPADKTGSTTPSRPARHAMKSQKPDHSMGGKVDTSQDAAVEKLNDQSYQAASKGQMYSAANTPAMTQPTGKMSPSGSSSSTNTAVTGAMNNPTK